MTNDNTDILVRLHRMAMATPVEPDSVVEISHALVIGPKGPVVSFSFNRPKITVAKKTKKRDIKVSIGRRRNVQSS